jgi:predicted DNA-binding mobile mystery protein A
MTIRQLAKRLDVDASRVVKIETAEIQNAVTLRTMKTVAESLDCHFIYCLVPKANLEQIIKNRAHEIADAQLQRTLHTMALEDQATRLVLEEQVKELVEDMLRHSWRHLWEE